MTQSVTLNEIMTKTISIILIITLINFWGLVPQFPLKKGDKGGCFGLRGLFTVDIAFASDKITLYPPETEEPESQKVIKPEEKGISGWWYVLGAVAIAGGIAAAAAGGEKKDSSSSSSGSSGGGGSGGTVPVTW